MRTKIELKPEHRDALMALAKRRGDEELSGLLNEAIEGYLQLESEREHKTDAFRRLAGVLTDEEAGELEDSVQTIRSLWR